MEHLRLIVILPNIVFFTGVIGFALYLGSVASFIVMNIMIEKQPSIQAVYWQRLFVSKISSVCTTSGICILTVSCWVSIFLQPDSIRSNLIIAAVLNGLITLNVLFFLSPLVKKVTAISFEQMKTSTEISAYILLKKKEDRLGAVNMILFIAGALIICFLPFD